MRRRRPSPTLRTRTATANDGSPGPRNSERQITAAAVTQGAVDFVYGASLRVFLIPNEGAITKVAGDFKDNPALSTKWMLSPFALDALTLLPSKRFATEKTIIQPLAVSSGVVSYTSEWLRCESSSRASLGWSLLLSLVAHVPLGGQP